MRRARKLPLAALLAGCSFTEIPPAPGSVAVNHCEEDSECAGGRCRNDICIETSTTLGPFLVEVTPSTTTPDVGGLPFFARIERPMGNIAIGPVGTVTATIDAATVDPSCSFQGPPPERYAYAPSGGTIPANLSFVPSERVLGIATPAYFSATDKYEGFRDGDAYRSTMSLPIGSYDIYIEPRLAPPPDPLADNCAVPPLLIRHQEISGSTALKLELPPPSSLTLAVHGPLGDASLAGWSIEVLDSLSGRVLSSKGTLSPRPSAADFSEYNVTVAFVPAHVVVNGELRVDSKLEGIEIVRVSPPENVVAPSFLFERSGLTLSSELGAPATIDLTPPSGYSITGTPLPKNVTIEGQASAIDTGFPVNAAVTLASISIEGASRQASFITTFQLDETGKFRAEIPPGTYRVRAAPPPALGLAAAEAEWQIRATAPGDETEAQAGKTIELLKAPFVTGEAFANGAPVFGAAASTVGSPLSAQTTVLERTLGVPPVLPRTSTDVVAADGGFSVSVDPGRYDFFVRPEARSRYPWLVLPSVDVPAGGLHLDHRKLSLPYVYEGKVEIDATETPVPGALIRAYVYVTASGAYTSDVSKSAAVIPVAEARTDEDGKFELLIPASLDEW